ncbi:MAG: CPBP family intramembrane glutamic endopeptidase [Candidatus Saccharimonadales bacterium]
MVDQTFAQELTLVVLILLYGTVLARLVPKKWHLYLNIFIGGVAIILGLAFGLTLTQMGLGHVLPGIFVAIGASIIITIATLIISTIPVLRRFFLGDDLAHASGKLIAFEAAIRIPLGTALVEEILFRGVLLGLLLQHQSTVGSLLISSVIFGLWHIFPTINTLESNDGLSAIKAKKARQAGSIIGAVSVTFVAGLLFGWLRIISNSIIAPWVVHWSINASGVLGIAVARKLERRKGVEREK